MSNSVRVGKEKGVSLETELEKQTRIRRNLKMTLLGSFLLKRS